MQMGAAGELALTASTSSSLSLSIVITSTRSISRNTNGQPNHTVSNEKPRRQAERLT
jgi:hypothetical protein